MRFALMSGLFGAVFAMPSLAEPPERALRPQLRPDAPEVQRANVGLLESLRPVGREVESQADPAFAAWREGFFARAVKQGIARGVLEAAFRDVVPDQKITARDSNQAEFNTPIWKYLERAVSATRIRNGQAALRDHGAVLQRIEQEYGVDREVVAAIWGMETAYGEIRGKNDVITALATLAFDGRRAAFFEAELIAALRILQAGDVSPRAMTGSWAGAMGHTQFMPSSYLAHAVDFTGDGKRDIWSDDPTDALASTGAYLKAFGWVRGQPWGVEVTLPEDFDYLNARRDVKRRVSEWAALGVRAVDGRAIPEYGRGAILLPAGARGVALMVFDNFRVIERYNPADAYVIAVGHLADRIMGGEGFRADWPTDDRGLSSAERREMQRRLTSAGFDTRGIDGRIGPRTIAAIRAFQRARGLVPDGYASLSLLKSLP